MSMLGRAGSSSIFSIGLWNKSRIDKLLFMKSISNYSICHINRQLDELKRQWKLNDRKIDTCYHCTSPTYVKNNNNIIIKSIESRKSLYQGRYFSISLLDKNHHKSKTKPWYNSNFMVNASPQEKEQWLRSLMDRATIRQNSIDGKYILDTNGIDLDSYAFQIVLESWSTSGINGTPQKCEEIISRLERLYDAVKKMMDEVRITNSSVTIEKENYDLIQKLFIDLQPTTQCYNEVIRAWSLSNQPIIARAERWLDTMRRNREYHIQLRKEDDGVSSINNESIDNIVLPNTESYNLFLSIISKGNTKKRYDLINNATKAQQLLQEMINIKQEMGNDTAQPNTDSFNYVIRAITRCKSDQEITKKMMDTLRLMELLQRNSDDPDNAVVKPNTMTYCMAIDAFGISAYQKSTSRKPILRRKDKVLTPPVSDEDSYLNDDENDPYKDIERAESILKYMHDLNDHGNYDVVPNVVAYNTIIAAYGRISSEKYPDATMLAESVLRRMLEVSKKEGNNELSPDTRSYNGVIRCWANSKQNNSGARAEWWLRRMWDNYEEDNTMPDVNTYNSVILAFHNIGQASQSEKLLEELLEMEERNKLKPNSETFSLVIRSWLQYVQSHQDSDVVHGCLRAYNWLSVLLKKEELGQDISSSPELFSHLIKTIKIVSKTTQDKSLLNLALKTFTKLKNSRHQLDVNSYQSLLQIGLYTLTGQSNVEGQKKFINTIILSCADDGFISKKFISILSEISKKENKEGIQIKPICENYFSNWPLPNYWYRNVPQHSIPSKEDCLQFIDQYESDAL